MATDPRTPEEWQEAVDQAAFWRLVDSAVRYGLVSYSGQIDPDRCDVLLARGAALGYRPAPDETLIGRYLLGSVTPPV